MLGSGFDGFAQPLRCEVKFGRDFHLRYGYLRGGAPDQVNAKLLGPQGTNEVAQRYHGSYCRFYVLSDTLLKRISLA